MSEDTLMNQNATTPLVIRPFARTMWHDLWQVRFAQLAEHGIVFDSTIPAPSLHTPDDAHDWDLHQIAQVYQQDKGNFWLAYFDEQPVGSIGAQDSGGMIEVRRLYVQSAYRRRGIGAALVHTLLHHCCQHHIL